MSGRLSLALIATRIEDVLGDPTVFVGTSFDSEYLKKFGKVFPAVWVVAQRATPRDDGRGYTGVYRQHLRVDLVVRIVVQRYPTDGTDPEEKLNVLHDAVEAALNGWQVDGAALPFSWSSSQDGPPYEAVTVADLMFQTETVYSRSVS